MRMTFVQGEGTYFESVEAALKIRSVAFATVGEKATPCLNEEVAGSRGNLK